MEFMTEWGDLYRGILEYFFKQTRDFVGKVLSSNENYMDCLYDFYFQAWKVPKPFKGNSSGMGFVPEYLIFEIVKQYLEKKYDFVFRPVPRSYTGNQEETFYFLDKPEEPRRLLVQGLKIGEDEHRFHKTNAQHDITYQVKEGEWRIKAIIEVKGFVDFPSLRDDLKKLQDASSSNNDCLFAFIGFNMPGTSSELLIDLIDVFTGKKNHFLILPGEPRPGINISSLKTFLENLS
jgi:hypothetical protein